jgi:uncharacterized integral membrane protein
VGIFIYQNQDPVPITFLQWTATRSLALFIGGAYVLGMLSGWSTIGLLRRSYYRATTGPVQRQEYAANR